MKKMRYMLCLAVLACFMFSGCKGMYQKMVEGTWKVDIHYTNGSEDTTVFLNLFNNYRIIFHSDGNFTETYKAVLVIPTTVSGTWEIEKKPDGDFGEFQLQLVTDNSARIYDIKEITKETIDISRETGEGDTERIILEPAPEE